MIKNPICWKTTICRVGKFKFYIEEKIVRWRDNMKRLLKNAIVWLVILIIFIVFDYLTQGRYSSGGFKYLSIVVVVVLGVLVAERVNGKK